MKYTLLLLFLYCLMGNMQSNYAQCNHDSDVQSIYDYFTSGEDYLLNQLVITKAEEERIGDSLHLEMSKRKGILQNHPQQARLNTILNTLTLYVEHSGITYNVYVLDDSETINAFSLAGGNIYLTDKLVNWVQSDDEMAFVIAHEMAHIDAGHSIRKVKKHKISKTLLGDDYGSLMANVQIFLSTPLGQTYEYQADKIGIDMVRKAGFSPSGSLDFFNRMAAEEGVSNSESVDDLDKMMRSHPYSIDRHDCLRDYIDR